MVIRTAVRAAAAAIITVLLADCGGSGDGAAPAAPLAAAPALTAATVIGADNIGIANFALVSSTRISRTVFEYTYTAEVSNLGTADATITATLISTAASTAVVDDALEFGDVARGATTASVDTFTIRQDRTVPFDENALVWMVAAKTGRVVVDHASVFLAGAGQSATLNAQVFDMHDAPVNAIVAWRSSAPDQVSVDATGRIEASRIGSAQIFAESGGVRSTPVFVIVAEPQPGALLVTDEQALSVGPPLDLAPDAVAGVGTHYEVQLQGISSAPAPGTVVLATENARVAGKVVSTRDEAGTLVVTLELVPLYDLLANYDINWTIDLAAYTPVAVPGASAASAAGPSQPTIMSTHAPQAAAFLSPLRVFRCDASVTAGLLNRAINIGPQIDMQLVVQDTAGHSKRAVVGSAKLVGSASLNLKANVTVAGDCTADWVIPIPVGGASLLVMPGVRFGVGAHLEGSLIASAGELSVTGELGISNEIGWECGGAIPGCRAIDEKTPINNFKPKAEVFSPVHGMRVELAGQFYALLGLDAVFFTAFNAPILEAKIGPVQKVDVGFEADQAVLPTYASKYDLKIEAVVEPGAALKDAIKAVINDDAVGVTFQAKATTDISESPKGTFAANKTAVALGGDTVDFTVNLAPTDYALVGYNVRNVELWRRGPNEPEFRHYRDFPFTQSGGSQSTFRYTWQPAAEDLGRNQFAAFVETELGFALLPSLEVTEDSVRDVTVSCFSTAAPTGATNLRPHALAAAAAASNCADTWVGTSTYLVPDQIRIDSSVTWQRDPNVPEIAGHVQYIATGTATVKYIAWENQGCSVTPTVFDVAEFADASTLVVNFSDTPPNYAGSGSTGGGITVTCPGLDPLLTSQQIYWFGGEGPVSVDGATLAGANDFWSWSFTRP